MLGCSVSPYRHSCIPLVSPSQQDHKPCRAPAEPEHRRFADGRGAARCGTGLLPGSVLLIATCQTAHLAGGARSVAVWNEGINLELAKGLRGVGVKGSSCTQEHGRPLHSRARRWRQGRIYPQLPTQEVWFFFAPVCTVTAARQISPILVPPRSSLLHRGVAALPGKRFWGP